MKRALIIVLDLALIMGLSACSSTGNKEIGTTAVTTKFKIGNPTPEQVLARDPDSDFFIFDGIVCVNASNVDWVQELDLAPGDSLGKIERTGIKKNWKNLDATVLSVGTEIFRQPGRSEVLIAVQDGKYVPYIMWIEG